MRPPRKKGPTRKKRPKPVIPASQPRKVIAQWGDGPLLQFERQRLAPLTDKEFWEACEKYFPPELHAAAAAYLLEQLRKAQRPDGDTTKARGPGRKPGGIGSRVEGLMTGPLALDQKIARRMVASSVCTCGPEINRRWVSTGEIAPCTCGAYERVSYLHNQWRRAQRKGR
jgi:hypothetical protein